MPRTTGTPQPPLRTPPQPAAAARPAVPHLSGRVVAISGTPPQYGDRPWWAPLLAGLAVVPVVIALTAFAAIRLTLRCVRSSRSSLLRSLLGRPGAGSGSWRPSSAVAAGIGGVIGYRLGKRTRSLEHSSIRVRSASGEALCRYPAAPALIALAVGDRVELYGRMGDDGVLRGRRLSNTTTGATHRARVVATWVPFAASASLLLCLALLGTVLRFTTTCGLPMSESERPAFEPPIVDEAREPIAAREPIETADRIELADPVEQPGPIEQPDPILAVLDRLEDRLEESQRLLARQTDIATSLHAENQRLKAGELRRALLPLVRDLIRVQDVLGQVLDAAVESTAAADLQIARDSILDALARNAVEQNGTEVGDLLDPRVHKVVGVEPADDPAADRTIADIVRSGFAWEDGTPIRAADVRVYRHTPAAHSAASPASVPDVRGA